MKHSRFAGVSSEKVETETQNLSQLVMNTVQRMEKYLKGQSEEVNAAQEEITAAFQSELGDIKILLEDLQVFNASILEQNTAGQLKLNEDTRRSFQTLYACNKSYLDILLNKEKSKGAVIHTSVLTQTYQAAVTSIVLILGGGLAGGLGAVMAFSSHKVAERNSTFQSFLGEVFPAKSRRQEGSSTRNANGDLVRGPETNISNAQHGRTSSFHPTMSDEFHWFLNDYPVQISSNSYSESVEETKQKLKLGLYHFEKVLEGGEKRETSAQIIASSPTAKAAEDRKFGSDTTTTEDDRAPGLQSFSASEAAIGLFLNGKESANNIKPIIKDKVLDAQTLKSPRIGSSTAGPTPTKCSDSRTSPRPLSYVEFRPSNSLSSNIETYKVPGTRGGKGNASLMRTPEPTARSSATEQSTSKRTAYDPEG